MSVLENLEPGEVFKYFEEISSIPHGSGNMKAISDYCMDFAKEHNLEHFRDDSCNVVIKKQASPGYENAVPLILQAHIDMVCQKTEESKIDFEKDGLSLYVEDGFVKARGTSLGADNGIGVAIMLAILSDAFLTHPALECVFTADEEVGMIGALALDTSNLKGKRMINLDGGGENTVLISCAGGADFVADFPCDFKKVSGTKLSVKLSGLPGGHSGTEIHKGGQNANALMTKILHSAYDKCNFEIISVNGGNKSNVITPSAKAEIVVSDVVEFTRIIDNIAVSVKENIAEHNPDMDFSVKVGDFGSYDVLADCKGFLSYAMALPSGVAAMSQEISGLVETSANLGIIKTESSGVKITVSVRSCIKKELGNMAEKLKNLSAKYNCTSAVEGVYPPWELKKDTKLQKIYENCHKGKTDSPVVFRAIHAGLECGIFDSSIDGLDCISVGPNMYDIHSASERLSISSTKRVYEIVTEVLKNCK